MPMPTKFREEYVEQAAKLCRLGATHDQLAEFFGVSTSTLSDWLRKHQAFAAVIADEKRDFDERVVKALHQRALGFEQAGKYYPPDVVACIFWLKNRRPDEWRDQREIKGKLEHEHYVAEVPPLAEDADQWLKSINGASSGGRDQPPKLDS